LEDLFLGGQSSIILGYRRLSVKSLLVCDHRNLRSLLTLCPNGCSGRYTRLERKSQANDSYRWDWSPMTKTWTVCDTPTKGVGKEAICHRHPSREARRMMTVIVTVPALERKHQRS
jgi:hypothetical protein